MEISPEFLTDAAAAGRPLRGLNLSGMALQGLKLDGLQLHNCSLQNANLSGASMYGVTFENVHASRTRFTAARLDRSRFKNVQARYSFFNHTSMIGIDWAGGSLETSFILNADASLSRWSGVATTGAIWAWTSLAFADLRGLEDGESIARWHACGTGTPEDRAALALFNQRLNIMSHSEAREDAEVWRRRLDDIRADCISDADRATLIRLELAAVYRLCEATNQVAKGNAHDRF